MRTVTGAHQSTPAGSPIGEDAGPLVAQADPRRLDGRLAHRPRSSARHAQYQGLRRLRGARRRRTRPLRTLGVGCLVERTTGHGRQAKTRNANRKAQVGHHKTPAITTSTGLRRRERRFESCRGHHVLPACIVQSHRHERALARSRGMARGTNSFHEPLHASRPAARSELADAPLMP